MHRNFSDLFSVIAELARLSKHSEWLINPLLFLALKNIRPMITFPRSMQLYNHELRVLLYRVLYVGLARSRSSSVFQYTVLFTGVPYVAYRYSCEAVWCTVRTRTVSAATCTAVRVP